MDESVSATRKALAVCNQGVTENLRRLSPLVGIDDDVTVEIGGTLSLVSMLVRSTIKKAVCIDTRKYNKDAFIIIKNQDRRDLSKSEPNPDLKGHHNKTERELAAELVEMMQKCMILTANDRTLLSINPGEKNFDCGQERDAVNLISGRNRRWDGHNQFTPFPGIIVDQVRHTSCQDIVVNMDGGVGGSWHTIETQQTLQQSTRHLTPK